MINLSDIPEILEVAQMGDYEALDIIVREFNPLIKKKSYLNNRFDEDCFQELNSKLINCIYKFEYNPMKNNFQSCLDNLTLNG